MSVVKSERVCVLCEVVSRECGCFVAALRALRCDAVFRRSFRARARMRKLTDARWSGGQPLIACAKGAVGCVGKEEYIQRTEGWAGMGRIVYAMDKDGGGCETDDSVSAWPFDLF